jgi:hypothetical protein
MTRIVRRGRPLGPLALAVVNRLQRGPAAVWQLRAELGLSYRDAVHTAAELRRGGRVVFGAPAPQRPGGRPARLLLLAEPTHPDATRSAAPLALPRGFFGPVGGDE